MNEATTHELSQTALMARAVNCIAAQYFVTADQIKPEVRLDHLGDSLDKAELTIALEDEFKDFEVDMLTPAMENAVTVEDVFAALRGRGVKL